MSNASDPTDLYILGSGGFAKEVCFLAYDITQSGQGKFLLRGFLDLTAGHAITVCGQTIPVFAESEFLNQVDVPVAVVVGTGDPSLSHRIVQRIRSHEKSHLISFPNLIHPSFIGSLADISMGKGNVITAGVIFTVSITIGDFNIFNLSTTVGHDTNIGSFNVFNPGCNISGSVQVGDRNLLGTNATVLQTLKLGNDLVLGAGSVATKNLPDGFVYIGSPAKAVRQNSPRV